MTCRKWLVRGLVLAVVVGAAAAVVLYRQWTNPEAVRLQILARLGEQLPGASINLQSASWRLLGGISVSEMHLARRDDPDRRDFMYVPSGIIYHDKEHMLDGKLRIRKLELDKPRLHIRRSPDGRWNLADILGPVDLNEQIPTIVIKQGTFLFEDLQTPGAAPMVLRDVNLTLMNDPVATLSFAAAGNCQVLGPWQIKGTQQRATDDTALSLEALNMPVGRELIERLITYKPELAKQHISLEGRGKLQAALVYRSQPQPAWSHVVALQISQGKLSHAQCPLPLEELQASLRCTNGLLSLDHCTARSGATRLEMSFKDLACNSDQAGNSDQAWEESFRKLDLKIEHLQVTKELFDPLPDKWQQLYTDFTPGGLATLTLSLERTEGTKWHRRAVIRAEDGRGIIREFPYGLEHITGTMQHDVGSGSAETLHVDLVGMSHGRPISIRGDVVGTRPDHRVDLDIWGEDIPLDEDLENALNAIGKDVYRLAKSFRPKEIAKAHLPMGKGNFHSTIHRDPRLHQFANTHVVYFHDALVSYEKFPILLDHVSGTLKILPDHRWEFHDFRGTRRGGEFRVHGHNAPGATSDQIFVAIEGTNIELDADLKDALQPDLQKTWESLQPSGRIDFDGSLRFQVEHQKGIDDELFPEIELTMTPRRCAIRPHFFDCPLTDLTGMVHYAKRWVTLDNLSARHGQSYLTVRQGWILVQPEGGFWAKLIDLEGHPLVPDDELLNALPGAVGSICKNLELRAPLSFRTELVVHVPTAESRPIIYWDGNVQVQDARLRTGVTMEHVSGTLACRGLFNGDKVEGVIGNVDLSEAWIFDQPFQGLRARLLVTRENPDTLQIPELWANYCGGQVYGPIAVEFGPTVHYEMRLTASQIDLEQFGLRNFGPNAHLGGLAYANLYLEGRGADLSNLRGKGSVDMPQGKIKELPPLIDLLKVFGLRAPDRTAFDEAHASFDIQGPRIVLNRFDLYGNLISVRGQGDLRVDGTDINLEFHADPARINQLLPSSIQDIPKAISDQVLTVTMKGSLGDLKTRRIVAPGIMGRMKDMWDDLMPGEKPKAQ